jgi:uncharacterized protein (TIGR03435 family)
MGTIRLFAASILLAAALARAQPAPQLTFDVASVKPTPPDAQCGMIQPLPGGGLRVDCLSLQTILTWAYKVQDFQISGGPAWIKSLRWDILAKAQRSEAAAGEPAEFEKMNDSQQQRAMAETRTRLQALLADRFQLAIHRETKDMPAFTLTVAKNGAKLTESANGGGIRRGRGEIVGKGAKMAALASFLAVDLSAPVTDGTGLTGRYDFQLEWTPDRPASAGNPGEPQSLDATGPSLFTAIQEQLGLRLEPHKAPAEVVVIDRAEKPAEN